MGLKEKLLHKRTFWVPTLKGWLVILVVLMVSCTGFVLTLNPWLSSNHPLSKGYLVIDGSIPDYALHQAITYFDSLKYQKMIITGGPVPVGSYHMKYQNYAEVGEAKLQRFGFPQEKIVRLNTPYALKDRTYHNALAVKKWMQGREDDTHLTVFEIGAHARRSCLLYQMAMEEQAEVGVIAIDDINYDPGGWWKSSIGFRSVIGEFIAYLYVRLFFRP